MRYYTIPDDFTINPIKNGYYLADVVDYYDSDRVYKDVIVKYIKQDVTPVFQTISGELPPGPSGKVHLKKYYKDWI